MARSTSYVTEPTDVLFDINGYFAPPLSSGLHFYPVTPCRVADTRPGAGFSGRFGPPIDGRQRTRDIPDSVQFVRDSINGGAIR